MIKLQIEEGNAVLYFTPRVFLHTFNQWKDRQADVFNMDFLNVYLDRDRMLDRYDVGIVVMGFGLSLKINTFDE